MYPFFFFTVVSKFELIESRFVFLFRVFRKYSTTIPTFDPLTFSRVKRRRYEIVGGNRNQGLSVVERDEREFLEREEKPEYLDDRKT